MITKDIIISIEIIKKRNLQSKSIQKGLGMTKVMFLLSMAPPHCPVTREKNAIYNKKTRVFTLPDQRKCARSHLRCARVHMGL
jgi:hypothetical protein